MDINFIEKDQDWQNETTRYWFSVEGENYCIADNNGELSLLDCEGFQLNEWHGHDKMKELLAPEYEKHIMD